MRDLVVGLFHRGGAGRSEGIGGGEGGGGGGGGAQLPGTGASVMVVPVRRVSTASTSTVSAPGPGVVVAVRSGTPEALADDRCPAKAVGFPPPVPVWGRRHGPVASALARWWGSGWRAGRSAGCCGSSAALRSSRRQGRPGSGLCGGVGVV